jgi:hypothetical protein
MSLVFYHRTTSDTAELILRDGFKDATGTYFTGEEFTGVWLSDRPLDANEGAKGKTLLKVLFYGTEDKLKDYEWIEEDKSYREWLVPASIVNSNSTVQIINEHEAIIQS